MRCAVVREDGLVVNIIIAELTDPAPDGCVLHALPHNVLINPGDLWADRQTIVPDEPVEGEP
jgi:hypothetical protein